MSSNSAVNRTFSRRQGGFTLVELMVAMAIGLILLAAVMTVELMMFKQSARVTDVLVRDGEARTALVLLSQDADSAGFGQSPAGMPACAVTLSAPSQAPGMLAPVWSAPATSGSAAFSSWAPNYPPAGSGVPTDVLLMTGLLPTQDPATVGVFRMAGFGQPGNGGGSQAHATFVVNSGVAPVGRVNAGDTLMLQVPLGSTSACFLMPAVSTSSSGTTLTVTAEPSGSMPPSGLEGFRSTLVAQGITAPLTGSVVQSGLLADLGPTAPVVTGYAVSTYAGEPALTRVVLNLTTGAQISSTPIALGVVSLQTRFLVGGTSLTWAQVVAQQDYPDVQGLSFALVVRGLRPDLGYTAPAQIAVPGFDAYPVQPAEVHDHFEVLESTVALRNLLWNSGCPLCAAPASSGAGGSGDAAPAEG